MVCVVCGTELDSTCDRCLTCGTDAGAPNVRLATSSGERASLLRRYETGVEGAKTRGAKTAVALLEQRAKASFAVINLKLAFLREFVTEHNTLFANYHAGVASSIRRAADDTEDQARTGVDAILFRSYADKIRFAALTCDGSGLISYGPYTLRLRDVAVAARSSILEQNSFDFVRAHKLGRSIRYPRASEALGWIDTFLL